MSLPREAAATPKMRVVAADGQEVGTAIARSDTHQDRGSSDEEQANSADDDVAAVEAWVGR